jgi:putative transcriptional regulator
MGNYGQTFVREPLCFLEVLSRTVAPPGVFLKGDVAMPLIKNRIMELRKPRKVTQAELAGALGVTRQTIISLETGRYIASLPLAHKIAGFFGKTIEEVFIFEEEVQNDGTKACEKE